MTTMTTERQAPRPVTPTAFRVRRVTTLRRQTRDTVLPPPLIQTMNLLKQLRAATERRQQQPQEATERRRQQLQEATDRRRRLREAMERLQHLREAMTPGQMVVIRLPLTTPTAPLTEEEARS